jgi:hypothetical protein
MGKTSIKLKQNRAVVLNGEEITQLPMQVEGINIRVLSSIFLIGMKYICFINKERK